MFRRAPVTAFLLTLLRGAHTSEEVCTDVRDGEAEHDDETSLLAVKTTGQSFSKESACEMLFKTCTNLQDGTPTCSEGATAPDGHSATKCTQGEAVCYSYQLPGGNFDGFAVHKGWSGSYDNTADGIGVVTYSKGCTPPTTTTLTTTTLTSTTLTSTTLTSTTLTTFSESFTNEWA